MRAAKAAVSTRIEGRKSRLLANNRLFWGPESGCGLGVQGLGLCLELILQRLKDGDGQATVGGGGQ